MPSLLLTILALAILGASSAAGHDRTTIIRELAASENALATSASKLRVAYTESYSNGQVLRCENVVQRRRDQDKRIRVEVETKEIERTPGRPIKAVVRKEFIFTGTQHAAYVPGASLQFASTPSAAEKWRTILRYDPTFGGFLDGWFAIGAKTGRTLSDLLQAGDCRIVGDEDLEGHSCVKLEAKGDNWTMTAWIVPALGHQPLRVDLSGTEPGILQSFELRYKSTKVEVIGGEHFVASATLTTRAIPEDGSAASTFEIAAQRESLELAPTLEPEVFSFDSIPNGTRVFVEEQRGSGIALVWQDGKPVPSVDASKVAQIRDAVADRSVSGGIDGGAELRSEGWPSWLKRSAVIALAGIGALALWLAFERIVLPKLRT